MKILQKKNLHFNVDKMCQPHRQRQNAIFKCDVAREYKIL